MAERFKLPLAVHVLLLDSHNSVWLFQRKNTGYRDGFFTGPAGHCDGGEHPKKAACREAEEEVGITIIPENLSFVHAVYCLPNVDSREYLHLVFTISSWVGNPTLLENKSKNLGLYPLNNLPQPMVPEVETAIKGLVLGNYYSEL